ncbi:hypothetical protein ATL41_1101 [Flavimobilis soli]|uniref:DUF4232 domain-containing protein n=2 Tax=Flavimobilis soli TaxID=442709 RepID=A0A2A9EC59_9MICO|nr:hypothetical protein ATL41_1101 [Flavimobilis soli]
MTKSRLCRGVMAGSVLVLLLAGCSDDPETPAPGTTGASSTTTDPAETPQGPALCAEETVADPASFATAGEIVAVQDEMSEAAGTSWRRYVPVTVTNPGTATCRVKAFVTVEGDGGAYEVDTADVVLEPGATANVQLFNLDDVVEFDGDTEGGQPVEQLTIAVQEVATWPVYDYYDADVEFGAVSGEGADAVLPVTITKKAVRDGVPAPYGLTPQDDVYIQGVDASGAVVAHFSAWALEAIEVGETTTYEIPATIAARYDYEKDPEFPSYAYQGLSATEDVAEYRVVRFEPAFLED